MACTTAGEAYILRGCESCITGKYQDQNDQVTSTCTLWTTCSSGEYVSQTGTPSADVTCSNCQYGQYQEADSFNGSSCTAVTLTTCSEGTEYFSASASADMVGSTADDAVCQNCADGKIKLTSQVALTERCTPCGLGKYADARTNCTKCPAGRYNNAIGGAHEVAGCTQCEKKTFSTAVGRQSACSDSCPTAVDAGASTVSLLFCILKICLHCFLFNIQMCQQKLTVVDPPFHHNTTTPSSHPTQCSGCNVGKYKDVNDNDECKDCPDGYFTNDRDLQSCIDCPAGYYAKNFLLVALEYDRRHDRCVACPRGKYGNVKRAADILRGCKICVAGRYSDLEAVSKVSTTNALDGSLFCKECPLGRWSSAVAVEKESDCQFCTPGLYSVTPAANQSSTCTECDVGRFCEQVGANSASACEGCPGMFYRGTPTFILYVS